MFNIHKMSFSEHRKIRIGLKYTFIYKSEMGLSL